MGLQSDVDSSDFQELITNNCEEILRSIVDFVGPRVNQSDSDRARFFCYFNHHTGIISCLNYLKQRCQGE